LEKIARFILTVLLLGNGFLFPASGSDEAPPPKRQ
jgi:hypothetical protein